MLGQCVRSRVVKPVGHKNKSGNICPLNYGIILGVPKREYAYILGIDHPVKNFDGRVIALLEPKVKGEKRFWILAPKSTRYINIDIMQYLDIENDFKNYKLVCLYESSSGAVVYREINEETRFLLIKNKRSANWGFPKGHLEMGETKVEAAVREVLEETGIKVKLHKDFESISKYKIKSKIEKCVSIFVGTTDDKNTIIQKEEIEDYAWLTFAQAIPYLKFKNDRDILEEAYDFLWDNNFIVY